MINRLLCGFGSLMLLMGSVSAQDVLVVDKNLGPGTDFEFLSDAVQAAKDGDVLLVRNGNYPNPIVLDGKGLRIVSLSNSGVVLDGTTTIRNLGPDQQVVLSHMEWSAPSGDTLVIKDNRGSVWLQEIRLDAGSSVSVSDCDSVILIEPKMQGAGKGGASALTISDSRVSLYFPDIRGAVGSPAGGAGIAVLDSQVTIQGGSVSGGGGRFSPMVATVGGSAIILGGTTGSSALSQLQCQLTGGLGGANPNGGSRVDGVAVEQQGSGGSQTLLPGGAHGLDMNAFGQAGRRVALRFTGHSNDRIFMLASIHPGALTKLSPVIGALVMDSAAALIPMGTYNNGSKRTITLDLPPIAIGSLTLFLQPFIVGPSSNKHLSFGEPRMITILGNTY